MSARSLDEGEALVRRVPQPRLLKGNIVVVVVDIVETDDLIALFEQRAVEADKASITAPVTRIVMSSPREAISLGHSFPPFGNSQLGPEAAWS